MIGFYKIDFDSTFFVWRPIFNLKISLMLGLCRADGSLEEDMIEIQGMFSEYFQHVFSSYPLSDSLVAAMDACFRVVPHKILVIDWAWILGRMSSLLFFAQCKLGNPLG